MKVLSWNINGIRSVYNKGFLDWFNKESPDIFCLQEVMAEMNDIPGEIKKTLLKKGCGGVGVLSRKESLKSKKVSGRKRIDYRLF